VSRHGSTRWIDEGLIDAWTTLGRNSQPCGGPVIRNCGAVLRRTGEGARSHVSRHGSTRWIDEGLICAWTTLGRNSQPCGGPV